MVLDVNDNAPRCPPTPNIHLEVSTAINTSVLQFRATDPDYGNNALLSYSLWGFEDEVHFLKINPTTGEITTIGELPTSNMTWNLIVNVSDMGNPPLSTECNLFIQLCITSVPPMTTTVPPMTTAPRSPDNRCDDNNVPSWAIAVIAIESTANIILLLLLIILSILFWRYYVK